MADPMPTREFDGKRLSDELVRWLADGHEPDHGWMVYLRMLAREVRDARTAKERPLAFKPGVPSDFACTSCGETMQSYDQFDEYQHEGCGGLVRRKEQPEAAEGSV